MSTQEKGNRGVEQQAADSEGQLLHLLEQDRRKLQQRHNEERSRSRAMATLAANPASPQGSGSSPSWISKLWNGKTLLGSIVVLAGGGSLLLGILLSSDSEQETGKVLQRPAVVEEVLDVQADQSHASDMSTETLMSGKEVYVSTAKSGKQSTLKYDVAEKREKGVDSEGLSEEDQTPVSASGEEDNVESDVPEVRRKGSLELNVTIDPVQSEKNE